MSDTTAPSADSWVDVKLTDREKVIADYFRKEIAEVNKRAACLAELVAEANNRKKILAEESKILAEESKILAEEIKKQKEEYQKQTELADSFKSRGDELSDALHIANAEMMRLKNKKRRVCKRK
ncbi:hypothetical protein DAKH74_025340 [Maudiozyma humilis]|uniref:Uncharacterized protein n=1 Tax=Maudiozyma humilis TaxID=51915 RepID=A0AAV5RZ88_MAUHU|nr:hypothetical protein DAKH74_025340 [Kazachstania humilis]